MIKNWWLMWRPLVVLLGLVSTSPVIASPSVFLTAECADCQIKNKIQTGDPVSQNSTDYQNDYDNSQDFDASSSSANQGTAPNAQNKTQNQDAGDNINYNDSDEDEE